EEIVKGSGLYKLQAAGCPRGTAEVVAQIERSQTTTGSGKVTGKISVTILGTGGEVGGELGGSVAHTSGASVQVKGCLLLDEETRLSNDASRMWKQLARDLKEIAPLHEALLDGERLLALRGVIKDLKTRREQLVREIRSDATEASQELVAELLSTVKKLEAAQREQAQLTSKLRDSKRFRSIR